MNKKRNIIIIIVVSIVVAILGGLSFVAFKMYTSSARNRNFEEEYNDFGRNFDWSSYSTHGQFGLDGIAWVCTENYTGSKCGYIKQNGEYVFDLMDKDHINEVKNYNYKTTLDDYQDGTVAIVYSVDGTDLDHGCFIGVYDTSGKVIDEVEQSSARCNYEARHLENGNILIFGGGFIRGNYYLYGTNSKKIKKLDIDYIYDESELEYSDGLLYIYRDDIGVRGPCYYDEDGNLVLKITTESNENFVSVNSGTPFENGKATINFKGKDNNNYTVTIDKKGNWLDEPVKVED